MTTVIGEEEGNGLSLKTYVSEEKKNEIMETKGKSILIADASPAIRRMMIKMLKRLKLAVFIAEATNGKEAFNKVMDSGDCSGIAPDMFQVILLDYSMPVIDGPSTAKRLRAAGYRGLIVGMTENVMELEIVFFLGNGANYVVGKPMDMIDLGDLFNKFHEPPSQQLEMVWDSWRADLSINNEKYFPYGDNKSDTGKRLLRINEDTPSAVDNGLLCSLATQQTEVEAEFLSAKIVASLTAGSPASVSPSPVVVAGDGAAAAVTSAPSSSSSPKKQHQRNDTGGVADKSGLVGRVMTMLFGSPKPSSVAPDAPDDDEPAEIVSDLGPSPSPHPVRRGSLVVRTILAQRFVRSRLQVQVGPAPDAAAAVNSRTSGGTNSPHAGQVVPISLADTSSVVKHQDSGSNRSNVGNCGGDGISVTRKTGRRFSFNGRVFMAGGPKTHDSTAELVTPSVRTVTVMSPSVRMAVRNVATAVKEENELIAGLQ